MFVRSIRINQVRIGAGAPLVLIAGPCVLESQKMAIQVAATLRDLTAELGLGYIFKASFDKANRSSGSSPRGPGLTQGLAMLSQVGQQVGVPVTTDVHLPAQAAPVAQVADLLQVPALLCRQTDLLVACGATGRPVNIKKGPFMAPNAMGHAATKTLDAGASGVLLTERGTTFGYGDLVVDMRSIPRMQALGHPVCLDATHGTQRPASTGAQSGGNPELAQTLALAGVAAGAQALFLEVHPDPPRALSDSATQLALGQLPQLLAKVAAVARAVRPTPLAG